MVVVRRGGRDRHGGGVRALLHGIGAREHDRLHRRELAAERGEAAELAAQSGGGERPRVVVAVRGGPAVERLDGAGGGRGGGRRRGRSRARGAGRRGRRRRGGRGGPGGRRRLGRRRGTGARRGLGLRRRRGGRGRPALRRALRRV